MSKDFHHDLLLIIPQQWAYHKSEAGPRFPAVFLIHPCAEAIGYVVAGWRKTNLYQHKLRTKEVDVNFCVDRCANAHANYIPKHVRRKIAFSPASNFRNSLFLQDMNSMHLRVAKLCTLEKAGDLYASLAMVVM